MTRLLIVQTRYFDKIADELLAGASAELAARGVAFETVSVPGALEIPQAVAMAEKSGQFDGAIALGCVMRGETSHYDIVTGESARGLMDIAIKKKFPIGNAILTVETEDQAWARADRKQGDKGKEAAVACLDVLSIKSGWAK